MVGRVKLVLYEYIYNGLVNKYQNVDVFLRILDVDSCLYY